MKITLLIFLLLSGSICFGSIPKLIIKSSRDTTIYVNRAFKTPAATAYDDEDGDISHKIEVFKTAHTFTISKGFVAYKVEDSDGNVVKDTIWTNTVDTTSPVIGLKFTDTIKVLINTSFDYLDYFKYSDNYNGSSLLKDNHQLVYSNLNLAEAGLYSVTIITNDESGNWSNEATLYIEVVTVLDVNNINDNPIQIYPNPSKGIIDIKLGSLIGESYQIWITNSVGRVVRTSATNFTSDTSLDLTNLSSGIFFINVKTKTRMYTKRLIIL